MVSLSGSEVCFGFSNESSSELIEKMQHASLPKLGGHRSEPAQFLAGPQQPPEPL